VLLGGLLGDLKVPSGYLRRVTAPAPEVGKSCRRFGEERFVLNITPGGSPLDFVRDRNILVNYIKFTYLFKLYTPSIPPNQHFSNALRSSEFRFNFSNLNPSSAAAEHNELEKASSGGAWARRWTEL